MPKISSVAVTALTIALGCTQFFVGDISAETQGVQTPIPPFDVAAAKRTIDAVLDREYPRLDTLYKNIHSHPEVAFQETRTAAILAAEMRKLGFQVTEHVGKTGIVAIYKNGAGPTVLVRTELDALPLEEKTGLPYASHAQQTVDGKLTYVDHACGHDTHMASWLGTAEALLALKNQWHGTLMFVGQPAEEPISGAKAMLADGLFTRFPKPDYAFAAHVGPAAFGTVTIKDGVESSNSDAVDIVFNGRGAHGSMPDKSIDPIVMGAHFVSDVQAVISREKDPQAFGVVTVGSFQSGTVENIIPEKAELKLTLRSYSPEVRKVLLDGVSMTAKAVSAMANAPEPTITYLHGTASVRNDSALAARASTVLSAAFGDKATFIPATMPGITASDDFSEFVDAGVPAVFFGIGGDDPKMLEEYKAQGKPVPVNHSPYFAPVPEPTIRTGVMVLTLAVMMVGAGG
jgi:hippurate hydrolase